MFGVKNKVCEYGSRIHPGEPANQTLELVLKLFKVISKTNMSLTNWPMGSQFFLGEEVLFHQEKDKLALGFVVEHNPNTQNYLVSPDFRACVGFYDASFVFRFDLVIDLKNGPRWNPLKRSTVHKSCPSTWRVREERTRSRRSEVVVGVHGVGRDPMEYNVVCHTMVDEVFLALGIKKQKARRFDRSKEDLVHQHKASSPVVLGPGDPEG